MGATGWPLKIAKWPNIGTARLLKPAPNLQGSSLGARASRLTLDPYSPARLWALERQEMKLSLSERQARGNQNLSRFWYQRGDFVKAAFFAKAARLNMGIGDSAQLYS